MDVINFDRIFVREDRCVVVCSGNTCEAKDLVRYFVS